MTKRYFGQEMPKNTVHYLVFQSSLNFGKKVSDTEADRYAALVRSVLKSAVTGCEVRVDVLRSNVRAGRDVKPLSFSADVPPHVRERAAAAVAGLAYSSGTA